MFLKDLLSNSGMTKYQVYKKSGLSWSTISDIFSGKISIERCSGKTLYQFASAMGCSIDSLIINERLSKIVQAFIEGEYITKNEYYRDVIGIVKEDVILAFESAIEYHNLTNGNFIEDVVVYSKSFLPYPFKVHLVNSFNNISYEKKNGINITSIDQTFNDLLTEKDIDTQIILESLGKYYFKNNSSFSNLKIREENIGALNKVKMDAITYWDEDE